MRKRKGQEGAREAARHICYAGVGNRALRLGPPAALGLSRRSWAQADALGPGRRSQGPPGTLRALPPLSGPSRHSRAQADALGPGRRSWAGQTLSGQGLLLQAPQPTSHLFHYSGGRPNSAWRSASPGLHCISANGNALHNLGSLGTHRLPHLMFLRVTASGIFHPLSGLSVGPLLSIPSYLRLLPTLWGPSHSICTGSLPPATPLHWTNVYTGSSSLRRWKQTVSPCFAKAFASHAKLQRCVWLLRGPEDLSRPLPTPPAISHPFLNMGLSHTKPSVCLLSPTSDKSLLLHLYKRPPSTCRSGKTSQSSLPFYLRVKSFHG